VILIDANILIYAFDAASPQHAAANRWIEERLNATIHVGMPWPSLLAFLRIVTNPRIMQRPATMAVARAQVRAWLACPIVWIPAPGESHGEILDGLLATHSVHGNLVMDAHIAALAIEHGLEVHSTDADFAKFANLRWVNPLAEKP
jgi:toxin-antitoxin system PIN domain toxin